jgi:hypothetical protein
LRGRARDGRTGKQKQKQAAEADDEEWLEVANPKDLATGSRIPSQQPDSDEDDSDEDDEQ